MKLSLGHKIVIMGSVPMLAFFVSAFYGIRINYLRAKEATHTLTRIASVRVTSLFINELQKEQSLSTLFQNNLATKEDLKAQQIQTDSQFVQLKEVYTQIDLNHKTFDHVIEASNRFFRISRPLILENKLSIEEIISQCNYIMALALHTDLEIANANDIQKLSSMIRSVNTLEIAKESVGKTKAFLVAYATENKSIDDDQLDSLIRSKNGTIINIESPSITVSEGSQTRLNRFESHLYWQRIDISYRSIVKRAATGQYGINVAELMAAALSATEELSSIISTEIDRINQYVFEIKSSATQTVWIICGVMAIFSTALLGFIINMVRSARKAVPHGH
ncbi:MAG: nitrate- and nitrite sensing domain-containing protein [Bdellovibrionota bacterium]